MTGAELIQSQALGPGPSIDAVIAAVAGRRDPVVLDSADATPFRGRFTVVACDPIEVAEWQAGGSDPFEGLRHRLARTRLHRPADCEVPGAGGFLTGWIGYLAYEAGRYIERLPATTMPDVGLPVARFGLYDAAAVHDAVTNRWTVVGADLVGTGVVPAGTPSIGERVREWVAVLRQAEEPARPAPPPPVEPTENMSRAQYLRMVRRAKEYIAAGDIFQVNLARRLSLPAREPPVTTYLRLRHTNPGAYAAFLSWGDPWPEGRQTAILSASPELFLHLKDGRVLTRPIKGTRPRSDDPVLDAAYRLDLAASGKDRAELAMIVDLERNDLGRVCEFGSVRVVASHASPADPYELETHPTVHHLVASVTGTLAASRDAIDLLRACFPGGSITGAPKVRAMEIIDELEPTERSVYTGAIGYLGLDGSMMLNIAIRTIILSGGRLFVYTGGGIVADSVPEDEYEETRAKALGLCRALGVAGAEPPAVLPAASAASRRRDAP